LVVKAVDGHRVDSLRRLGYPIEERAVHLGVSKKASAALNTPWVWCPVP
jgi:hypothetical protein